MCDPSIVAHDWVTKGFHIHIGNVELRVYPDHVGKVGFAPIFSSTPENEVANAIKIAYEICLANADVRNRWIQAARRATSYMLGVQGELQDLARGRMGEFRFLEAAINNWRP
jgi:hypothetical protein